MRKQTQIRHEASYKQLEVTTNSTSFLCGNRNGHHNTELRTYRHIIGKHKKIKTSTRTPPNKMCTNDNKKWKATFSEFISITIPL